MSVVAVATGAVLGKQSRALCKRVCGKQTHSAVGGDTGFPLSQFDHAFCITFSFCNRSLVTLVSVIFNHRHAGKYDDPDRHRPHEGNVERVTFAPFHRNDGHGNQYGHHRAGHVDRAECQPIVFDRFELQEAE